MVQISPDFSLTDLDARARQVFRDIVNNYLETGHPIGSRTLALTAKQSVSPATLRNTMSDLMHMGLLSSPHTSAGRVPTQLGLRLFVDGLLETGDISSQDRSHLEAELASFGRDPDKIFEQASNLLSGLAGGAGLVLKPIDARRPTDPIKHVEFVSLDSDQILVVLVYTDGRVENRLMPRPSGLLPASLERAGQFLSTRLQGRVLGDARQDILDEIKSGEAEIDRAAKGLIESGLADWSDAADDVSRRTLIVRGRAKLLENLQAQTDIERIQQLFDDLERKEDIIALLDQTLSADGVKLFIGTENPIFSLSKSSVLIAPYRDAQKTIIGAIGVIGPTRLNYARIIPMVDCTAQIVGRMLDDIKG